MFRFVALLTPLVMLLSSSIHAQNIDQSRGADQNMDYSRLVEFGPWDDRNYQLKSTDLGFLASDEEDLADPIPAFFRVELRKEFPHLRKSGPAQYPRAAVPLFYKRYGGLIWNGRRVETNSKTNSKEPEELQRGALVNSEIQLNDVLGANESTIEINPANPLQVIAGSNNNGGQEMYYSDDGGLSWTIQGTLPDTCCDPTVDWNSDGTIAYAAALSGAIGVSFWRSFDQGHTWVDRINLTSSGSDKEWVHVDRSPVSAYQDNVYLTYHNGNTMQFARSTDDGANFDIQAFGSAPPGIGSDITTTPNGDIYYLYGAFGNQTITLLKSTDGGSTFLPPSTVASTNASFDWPIPAMESRRAWIYATAASDRSAGPFAGSVYSAWTDTTGPESGTAANNHAVINVAYTRDGGTTWNISNPHPMDDTDSVDRFNQWMTVDENGTLHVVFYDTRHSDNRTGVDLYYNFSTDGGVTWNTEQRVSSETSANLTGGQEWGDYNGISVLANKLISTHTDNRNGPPNEKDIFATDMVNQAAEPTFSLQADNLVQQICLPDSLDSITIQIGQILDYDGSVTLSTSNEPANSVVNFSLNPASPPAESIADITFDGGTAAGTYNFEIIGDDGNGIMRMLPVAVLASDLVPNAPTLNTPADGSTNVTLTPSLTWNGVPQSGSFTIEIDDDPAFASINLTADVNDTIFAIESDLNSSTRYYWRVRSSNSCGIGADSAVFSFTTMVLPGDCADNSDEVLVYEFDFESGAQGWTHSATQGADTWTLSGDNPNSGAQHFHADDIASESDQLLVSPVLAIPDNLDALTFQFVNYQELEDNPPDGCYDAGILEFSINGGTSFSQVDNADLLTDPYDGTVDDAFNNPIAGQPGWCGDPQPYLNSIVNIDDLAGQNNVVFRFRLATDLSVDHPGWDIDDVKVEGCDESVVSNPDLVYEHGFEMGDAPEPPDLFTGDTVVFPNILGIADELTITATAKNRGKGTSYSTDMKFYISDDITISDDDTLLGTRKIPGLLPGGASIQMKSAGVPVGPGVYWVGACISPLTNEIERSNQCTVGVPITVSDDD